MKSFQKADIDDDRPEEICNKENPEIRLLKELHEQIIKPPKQRKRKRRDDGNKLTVDDNISPEILEKLEDSIKPTNGDVGEDVKEISGMSSRIGIKSRSKKMYVKDLAALK